MESSEIETSADSLGSSIMFHVVNDILGFLLYMYQQIPSILPDMRLEFATIQGKCKELETELAMPDLKGSSRRNNLAQLRELKQVIRIRDKFMNTVSRLQSGIELVIKACPDIREVMLVLGGSILRPLCAYSLCFLHGNVVSGGENDLTKSKAADALSRKAIRALISQSAGSSSCPGSMKLFLLVKVPSSFNHPLDFLPKRDFKISKKVHLNQKSALRKFLSAMNDVLKSSILENSISGDFLHMTSLKLAYLIEVTPFRLLFRCRKQIRDNDALIASHTGCSDCLNKDASNISDSLNKDASNISDSLNRDLSKDSDGLNKDVSEDLIWFQCRHVVKGLAPRSPTLEG